MCMDYIHVNVLYRLGRLCSFMLMFSIGKHAVCRVWHVLQSIAKDRNIRIGMEI